MPAHMRPRGSKSRPVGALAIALGVAVLALAAFDGGADDDTVTLVRPATDGSTEPTVLGGARGRSTTLPPAPPASPATFALTSDDPAAVTTRGGARRANRPERSTSATLGPPVSITSPNPPRTTTTTAPTTSTTEDPTTTTESTTTTEAPATTTTEGTTATT